MFVVHPDGQLEPCGEPVPLLRHYRFDVAVALDSDAHLELLETIVWIQRKLGASFATVVPKAPAIRRAVFVCTFACLCSMRLKPRLCAMRVGV